MSGVWGYVWFILGGLYYIFIVLVTITPHPGSKSVYPTSPRGVGGEGNHAGLKRGKEKNGTRRSQSWDECGVEIGRGR